MDYLLTNFILIFFYGLLNWVLGGHSKHSGKHWKWRFFMIVSFLQMLFYYTFTSYFSDLVVYGISFEEIKNTSFLKAFTIDLQGGNLEPGYRLLMWSISSLTGCYRLLLAFNGFVILYCYFKTFKRYSPYFVISVLFFLLIVFHPSIYILRQHISMAILLLSYPYIISGNLRMYLMVCFVAMSLHHSALFFLPVYFFYNIKKIRNYLMVLFGGLVAMTLFVRAMMALLAGYIERYSKFMDETNQFYGGMNWTYAIIVCTVLLIYIITLKKQVFIDGFNKLVLSLLCIGAVMAIACVGTPVPSRTILCYYIAAMWAIPMSLSYIKIRLLRYTLFLISLLLYFYIAFVSEIAVMEDYYLDF